MRVRLLFAFLLAATFPAHADTSVQPGAGMVRMTMSCPARDDEPAVVARLEVSYTPTSFEGSGSVEITPKARSQAQKGMSVLFGKRLGDC